MKSIRSVVGGTVLAAAVSGAAVAGPVLDPTAQAFVDKLAESAAPPIYTLTPAQARKVLDDLQQSHGPEVSGTEVESLTIPGGPTGSVRLHVVRPAGVSERLPAILYFHGAGWVMGDFTTHGRLMREIAKGVPAVVIFVDYERSPEAKYPTAIEQDYAATAYVAAHPDEFNIDATRLAIAGDSVGGNMVAVVSLLAKERKGPAIAYQVMFYPVTDARLDSRSYSEFAQGPWLTRKAMEWFWDAYLPAGVEKDDPYISPLRAEPEALKGLPPALVITDENDVLRDEGEAYARKLIAAGVPTVATRYSGIMHDFVMLDAVADTPAARAAVGQAVDRLRAALHPAPVEAAQN